MPAAPLDDFRDLLNQLWEGDDALANRVATDFLRMNKPEGSLGRLEELAVWLARWSGKRPAVNRAQVALFAGNHGIARLGLSPRSVVATQAEVELCAAGGAAINQICIAYDLGLKVYDLALDHPTADITEAPALDERGCAATMAFGMEAVAEGADLLAIGSMGVGGSTVAAALSAALFGGAGAEWVGPGSGANSTMVGRKADAVDKALALHAGHLDDSFEVLRRLGGREFAAIVGAILAARAQRIPIVLDGFSSTAAAAVLFKADPRALDHCVAGHISSEPGHRRLVELLGLKPLVDLGLHHGQGTGAALAAGFVKAAAQLHTGMAAALAPLR